MEFPITREMLQNIRPIVDRTDREKYIKMIVNTLRPVLILNERRPLLLYVFTLAFFQLCIFSQHIPIGSVIGRVTAISIVMVISIVLNSNEPTKFPRPQQYNGFSIYIISGTGLVV